MNLKYHTRIRYIGPVQPSITLFSKVSKCKQRGCLYTYFSDLFSPLDTSHPDGFARRRSYIATYIKYTTANAAAAAPPMLPKILAPPATGTSEGPGVAVSEGTLSVEVGVVIGVLVVPLTTTRRGGDVQLTSGTGDRVTTSLVEVDSGQELQVTVEPVVASTP